MAGKKNYPNEVDQARGVSDVESRLQSQMMTVRPDPEFIRNLQERLADRSDLVLEPETQIRDLVIAMAVAGGGILIFVTMLRLLYELLIWVGLIKNRR